MRERVLIGSIAYLRQQADKCRRLAREVGDANTAEELYHLAREYDAQAQVQTDQPAAWSDVAGHAGKSEK